MPDQLARVGQDESSIFAECGTRKPNGGSGVDRVAPDGAICPDAQVLARLAEDDDDARCSGQVVRDQNGDMRFVRTR